MQMRRGEEKVSGQDLSSNVQVDRQDNTADYLPDSKKKASSSTV